MPTKVFRFVLGIGSRSAAHDVKMARITPTRLAIDLHETLGGCRDRGAQREIMQSIMRQILVRYIEHTQVVKRFRRSPTGRNDRDRGGGK
ncbi:hypothetical protein ZHAS_00019913 [Anopheles sinensis]|uniref:Uncharacterized protein n=1 Tax=Anopheles sinensis TaxID=74873 RepID=A0A084WMI9_ANOSI|nr:hypothetical protein ZHAS_00019913 [Anopheles sinensis]